MQYELNNLRLGIKGIRLTEKIRTCRAIRHSQKTFWTTFRVVAIVLGLIAVAESPQISSLWKSFAVFVLLAAIVIASALAAAWAAELLAVRVVERWFAWRLQHLYNKDHICGDPALANGWHDRHPKWRRVTLDRHFGLLMSEYILDLSLRTPVGDEDQKALQAAHRRAYRRLKWRLW